MSVTNATNTFRELDACRVVSTANIAGAYFNGNTNNGVGATLTLTATGALVIDGVTLALNNRVLLTGQTLGYQNGIYLATNIGAAGTNAVLTRSGDYQSIEQVRLGHHLVIAAGTANAGSEWTTVEPAPAALGVPLVSGANNIIFVNVGSVGAAADSLQIANNLSELANPTAQAAALANLGVHAAKFSNAGGSATVSITDAKITAASVVTLNMQSSANAVTVQKVTPGAGTITVLCSADPGVSVLAYHSVSAVE